MPTLRLRGESGRISGYRSTGSRRGMMATPTPSPESPPETDRWARPLDDFRFVLFERIDVEQNEQRYYLITWQPTLFGWGVVRIWGRKGETQNLQAEPFPSLTEAWPAIRGHIRARLRHGYQIVGEG